MRELHPTNWLRYAGILTWCLVGIALLLAPLYARQPLTTASIIGAWSAMTLFLLAFLHPWSRMRMVAPFWQRVVALAVMTAAVIAVSYFSRSSFGAILSTVIAGILPWLLPRVLGVAWLFCLSLVFAVMVALLPQFGWIFLIPQLMILLGLMLFAFAASTLALEQLRARDELRRVNSELRATQSLLAENTRIAERVRIARELHDLVGHHLTALSLNLEVASHTSAGKTKEHVDRAGSIARLLLSDVREVVSDMRQDDRVDLREAVRELASGVPEPAIHLDIPDELSLTDPKRAQILLRCAQEVITNTVRHARAQNLWIRLTADADGLRLEARDDGRGAAELLPGNGLTGMRERIKELGGRLEIMTRPDSGFRINAWMPPEAPA
ncbi:sensor histidine kinase [Wenzhouxiangella sp. XN79A]|uniref:sensor histidine kinase n=1 Tax=Wenzhouxiangella sp. XN79A TaxID=2724193 RepID=UPI00144AEBB4|nr:sensor histidine kinase [Wenzhouxiangella sp. XN79A]NKI35425.1 sensor histidine kinase [Wenzhouxiangella sp. XN79A]